MKLPFRRIKPIRSPQLFAIIVMILWLGTTLRIVNLNWGLPYQLDPDEPALIINAWERATIGQPRIKVDYPPLYMEVLVGERHLIDTIFGQDTPQVVHFFFARWVNVLITLLLLTVAYRTGKTAGGEAAGIILMLFLALEPDVAIHETWRIKADGLAWLLALLSLWATFKFQKKAHPGWLGVALVVGILATLAKYNMVFILIAPLFAGLKRLLKFDWRGTVIIFILSILLISGARILIRNNWVEHIGPYFRERCYYYTEKPLYLDVTCEGFWAFQNHASDFYVRENFIRPSTFRHIVDIVAQILKPWRLMFGAGLLLIGLWRWLPGKKPDREIIEMLFLLMAATGFLMALVGFEHPLRQYYALILVMVLLVASILAQIARQDKRLVAGLMLLFFLPYLITAIDGQLYYQKKDTRALTADYMLAHVARGTAILIERDRIEFMPQYGGFPAADGYFNMIEVDSAYEYDLNHLSEEGIHYVIADEWAKNAGGYYAHPENWPDDRFELLAEWEGDSYTGPGRRVYRTFRPENPLNITFQGVANLVGYDVRVDAETNALIIRLYWQSLGAALPEYSVFIHVFDTTTGEKITGHDGQPEPPFSFWKQYEWVFDEREIALPADSAAPYRLNIGIYDPVTGGRVPIQDSASDFVEFCIDQDNGSPC